jgi:hypothetical protein
MEVTCRILGVSVSSGKWRGADSSLFPIRKPKPFVSGGLF